MYGWKSGPDGSGDNMRIQRPGQGQGMFGNNVARQGGLGGQGWGGGMGGGRAIRPLMNAWQQQYTGQPRSAWMGDFRNYMQSQPVQDWRGTRPQRPEGGWADPAARQAAFTGWYNQAPDAPWGAIPDWQAPTAPAGGGMGGGGNMGNNLRNALMQGFPGGAPSWLQALLQRRWQGG